MEKQKEETVKTPKKVLRKWNGRAPGSLKGSVYIAAYTKKEACELLAEVEGIEFDQSAYNRTFREISQYFAECWGNSMEGIEPTKPCVYHQKDYSKKPKRII